MKLWKFGLVGVVVLAIAGTAAGLVAAQTGSSTPDATSTQDAPDATSTKDGATSTPKSNSSNATPTTKDQLRDQFLNSLAANLGVSRDQLNTALTKTLNSMIDKAVADGKITQSEADKIKSKIAAGDFPLPGGFGRGFHQGFEKGFAMGANLQDIATFLNVDMSVIRDGLTNDQSLAQIAQAHGRSRDDLKSFLISNVTDKLNTAVKNQDISRKRADQALQNV